MGIYGVYGVWVHHGVNPIYTHIYPYIPNIPIYSHIYSYIPKRGVYFVTLRLATTYL